MKRSAQEFAARIGHGFADETLLEQALSHRSAAGRSNERLEFLGDAILNFVVAEMLYGRFPQADEGRLTRMRARLVRRETLAELARELELGEFLRLGGGELKSGGRGRDSILADALEAVLGAIHVDGGIDASRASVLALIEPRVQDADAIDSGKDSKTRLQEHLQSRGRALPAYAVVSATGPPHRRAFTVECVVDGLPRAGIGRGTSRRRAEQEAARDALLLLEGG